MGKVKCYLVLICPAGGVVPPKHILTPFKPRLQGIDAEHEELGPLVLIDTAGCGMEEAVDEDSDSRRNEGEAKVSPVFCAPQLKAIMRCALLAG